MQHSLFILFSQLPHDGTVWSVFGHIGKTRKDLLYIINSRNIANKAHILVPRVILRVTPHDGLLLGLLVHRWLWDARHINTITFCQYFYILTVGSGRRFLLRLHGQTSQCHEAENHHPFHISFVLVLLFFVCISSSRYSR